MDTEQYEAYVDHYEAHIIDMYQAGKVTLDRGNRLLLTLARWRDRHGTQEVVET